MRRSSARMFCLGVCAQGRFLRNFFLENLLHILLYFPSIQRALRGRVLHELPLDIHGKRIRAHKASRANIRKNAVNGGRCGEEKLLVDFK